MNPIANGSLVRVKAQRLGTGTIRARHRSRTQRRSLALLAGATALALAAFAAPSPALAQQRGTQLAPPQDLVLVSKDVGDERWAIALDLRTGTATGNVFPRSGGAPSFLWCSAREVTIEADPKAGAIYFQTPIAEELHDAQVGDSVTLPRGDVEIVAIDY